METIESLVYILMQELFENGLYDIEELTEKYTLNSEQVKELTNIYNELYGEQESEILTPNETINIWLETLLAEHNKKELSELTTNEIQAEIEETKGTIANEELWAKSDTIHLENLKILNEYLERLKNLLTEKGN